MKRRDFLRVSGVGGTSLVLASSSNMSLKEDANLTLTINPDPRFDLSPWLYMQFMEPLGVTDSSVEAAWDHSTDNDPDNADAVSYGIGWANVSNTPFFQYKVQSYEGGTSAPFIAFWPDKIEKTAGTVYHTQACLIDIMPTLIAVSDAQYPKTYSDGTELYPLEGISQVTAFVNGKGKEHQYMFWEHSDFSAIRKGDWKAFKKVTDADWELYDLKTDRDEQINLAEKQPMLVKELNDKWYGWATSHQVLQKKNE